MRKFDSGATRNEDKTKPDYAGFLSPLVIERFGEYMNAHRQQSDGTMRTSDNWKKGIPLDAYLKSGWRHFHSWWKNHDGYKTEESLEESLCAVIFNASGYLHEILNKKHGNNRT